MKFIGVFHTLSIVLLAVVAAPAQNKPVTTLESSNTAEVTPTDTFDPIDFEGSQPHAIVEEANPKPDPGCIVA
ncbi:hypothetical protein B0H19DRAFT_1257924 [Mycena capillaripes]|nr:hypothetical protein B0H19DRAFT_1257924 [Mycena capillaripes]